MTDFELNQKIHFRTWKKLLSTAFHLSSLGYGVAVIGFADMSENILTITALPEPLPFEEVKEKNDV